MQAGLTSLQSRILTALHHRSVTPRALYQATLPDAGEAVDAAVRSLVKDGLIALRCGHFVRTDAVEPDAKPARHKQYIRARPGQELTHREEEIAGLAAQGETARALAIQLGIAIKSVHRHLTNIYRKLEVSGKTELAARLRAREAA